MPLTPGTRLGSFELVSILGSGGMGEVYRATDTTLGRQVAIKILPDGFASDPDRLARFEREAKTLASLNHPNIAAIYGFEAFRSGGSSDPPTRALVMELVEGPTLEELIGSGGSEDPPLRTKAKGIPLEQALPIAKQIAEALEAAHEQGIIHRDLKPANIKVRADGTVKVLDFGLAKAMGPAEAGHYAQGGDGRRVGDDGRRVGDDGRSVRLQPDLSQSPTLTSPAMMTGAGMILGTAAYMAPEQARGKAVDKRADIWAFGAVLFEMLTGQRAFPGDNLTDTLAAVVLKEPAWVAVPAATPWGIQELMRRCLVKDPRQRIRDMGDVRLALEGGQDNDAVAAVERQTRHPLLWASVVIAAASLAIAAFALWNRPTVVPKTSARLTIPLPPGQEITTYPAITRDGRTVAYVTQQGADEPQLYLRDLNSFGARAVPGSGGARQPFFSPDGKWVAFFAHGGLQKAEVAGGAPIRLADAAYSWGGTWNEDNTIIYTVSLGSGLWRIPASGGPPESLTQPDGAAKGYAHTYPQALPGGRRVLFTTWGQTQGGAVLSLDSGQWELVLPGTTFASSIFDAAGGTSGRLLLVDQAADIRTAPFDAAHPARTSVDASVLADVYYELEVDTLGWLAVSDTGTAVYATGNPARMSLVWVDREGKIESAAKDQDVYREASLSPDGIKAIVRHGLNLWMHDLVRGTRSPLTAANSNMWPVWSRDGARIIFASNRGGDWDIYTQPADGSRPAEALLKRPYDQFPTSTLPDGTVLYLEVHPKTGRDLWTLSPDGKTSPLRVTPFNELAAQFSPGPEGVPRWVAYTSDESGRSEVYVQSYPSGEHRIAVSTGGGFRPVWSPDGKELFYVTGEAVVAVAMRSDGSVGAPHRLFDRSNYLLIDRFLSYSVSPDGKRFLMIQRDPGSVPRQLNVILNWSGKIDQPTPDGQRTDPRR